MELPRVITMLPSATEIVCALGYRDAIVARSHECDYPNSIKQLPACTKSKIDTQKSSRDIDNQVKFIVEQGLSVYRVDGDLLKKLNPDVIVTQTQCEVCAASPKDLEDALSEWIGGRPKIVSLEPNGLTDVWTDIQNVANAIGEQQKGKELVKGLLNRMSLIEKKAAKFLEGPKGEAPIDRPRIACIEWLDPLMAAGNWIPELVEMLRGENVFGAAGQHSPWIEWDTLCKEDPDVIVVMPCGYDISESRRNMPALSDRPEWSSLKAVKKGTVYIVDGNQYFNRPGPRLADSLEIMAQLVSPEVFKSDFEFEGIGWERFS
ncbi:MAG TPA: cobalamin-binding protein [Rhodospirillales bacterium]|nr:cobalamin-binding protein [Rhodospirillales bacterium]